MQTRVLGFSGLDWKQLIAERDARVNRITELTREIAHIDAELEKNSPPANVCVAVWQPKRKRAKLPANMAAA
ncbi:MAG TPA: hypothetical protein VMD97_01925 [Candidatus Aquilonibacter sp.]|nr:hypothetical protein [Candidatus Aquilonibacter sp.]